MNECLDKIEQEITEYSNVVQVNISADLNARVGERVEYIENNSSDNVPLLENCIIR